MTNQPYIHKANANQMGNPIKLFSIIMKRKLFYPIFFNCFISLFFLSVKAQVNDWENPKLVSQNTIEPHAHFIPYPGEQEALKKNSSPFIQSLDGVWKFNLSENPSVRSCENTFTLDGHIVNY